jgi:hypothetical protein
MVLAIPVDRLRDVRLERPEARLLPDAREEIGERRTPGARANDGAPHQETLAARRIM